MILSLNIKKIALVMLAVLLGGLLLFVVLPFALSLATTIIVAIFPVLLAIAGIVSCVLSQKTVHLKILWLIVIFLAPILGPLLWFFWGKKHT